MEDIAEGIVAGFAISAIIPVMYYFNKAALGALFAVNRAIGKALVRVLLPSRESHHVVKYICNDDNEIVCAFCGHYHSSLYDCTKQELKP